MSDQHHALHETELQSISTVGGGTGVMTETAPSYHEQAYREAHGDISRVCWADGRPNRMLISWLNAEAPGLIRPGSRVVVVGCGLGDDVCELSDRGYDAQGFDIAPTAINWARQRFPSLAKNLMVADLMNLPPRFRHRFDLVVEVYTLQSMDPATRERAAEALASLATPHGVVLAVCRGRDESELLEHTQGPPWPLTVSELTGLMEAAGLRPLRAPDDFLDDEAPPVRRVRGAFVRA
jgi:SAM-dependent methyltransferase